MPTPPRDENRRPEFDEIDDIPERPDDSETYRDLAQARRLYALFDLDAYQEFQAYLEELHVDASEDLVKATTAEGMIRSQERIRLLRDLINLPEQTLRDIRHMAAIVEGDTSA